MAHRGRNVNISNHTEQERITEEWLPMLRFDRFKILFYNNV